jgi:hypothetical protein
MIVLAGPMVGVGELGIGNDNKEEAVRSLKSK